MAANLVHTKAQIRNRTTTTGTAIAGIRVAHFESLLGAFVGSTGASFTTYGLNVIAYFKVTTNSASLSLFIVSTTSSADTISSPSKTRYSMSTTSSPTIGLARLMVSASTVMLSSCLLNRLPLFSCTWYKALFFHDSNSRVVSKLTVDLLQYHVRSRFLRSLPFSCPHLYAAASLTSIT